ncbi:uncharacterized protein LOC105212966 isoform X2 [Zeugodacus cucurbitae]|uniref:Solute carrier family 12 member 7 n=1 Tax=Zeugodacus cucurbitae TaxID=28588 RepID=A0A0A1WLY6_ZEUCU|nr:uncharacterized protein LOC105212966 isoform X2 [Zeugodacus cucurbitae]
MSRFFTLWKSPEDGVSRKSDKVSKFLLDVNESFKIFLNSCSWFVYAIAAFLISCCIYYYVYDCKRRLELRRRRQEVQRANERVPQRRRPGAIYRDHEIFRNVMRTVRQYIGHTEDKNQTKPYVLRRTRSGAIYGRFAAREGVGT